MKDAGLKLDSTRTAKRALYAKVPKGGAPLAVAPAITHSPAAVKAFVAGVAAKVRHAPRDAGVRITLRRVRVTHSRTGKALAQVRTRRAIDAGIDDPAAPRAVRRRLTTVQPETTVADLRRSHGTVITIDRSSFRLRLFKSFRWRKTYGVAVGQPAYPTPTGLFSIANKQVNPVWSVPNSPWAGELAGHDGGRRLGRQPAQGALDGHHRRRRASTGRARTGPSGRAPRTAASACTCPTSSRCTPASRSGRRCSSPAEPPRRLARPPIIWYNQFMQLVGPVRRTALGAHLRGAARGHPGGHGCTRARRCRPSASSATSWGPAATRSARRSSVCRRRASCGSPRAERRASATGARPVASTSCSPSAPRASTRRSSGSGAPGSSCAPASAPTRPAAAHSAPPPRAARSSWPAPRRWPPTPTSTRRNAEYQRLWGLIVEGADNVAYRLALNTLTSGQHVLAFDDARTVAPELADDEAIRALAAAVADGDAGARTRNRARPARTHDPRRLTWPRSCTTRSPSSSCC